MFDWLFEGRLTIYVLLGLTALGLLYCWWKQQNKRIYLIGAAFALALMALYFLLNIAVETDSEQIVRKVKEMADGIGRRDLDATFAHISDNFRSPHGKNKQALREFTRATRASEMVSNIAVWDFHFRTPPDRASGRAEIIFQFKPTGAVDNALGGAWFNCAAEFDHDSAHGWRLVGCRLFPMNTRPEGTGEATTPF